jgi:hypothetical protein
MIHVPRQELLQQIQSTEPHFIRSLPYWQKPRSRSSFFGVQKRSQHDWLVVSNMAFIFHNTWDVILPIDIHMFQRGWNHQPDENGSKCHSIPSEKKGMTHACVGHSLIINPWCLGDPRIWHCIVGCVLANDTQGAVPPLVSCFITTSNY